MRMAVLTCVLMLALIVCVACDLAGPETVPKDPGDVFAVVTDQSGSPLRDAWVYVRDIPNSVGSTYSVGSPTNADGTIRIRAIPAGTRRVEVKPLAGYSGAELIKTVQVVKGASVTVAFVLTRDSG